ncbi:MAG: hypothetical protein M0R33_05395 [Methylomonas sp.]|jgi:hypothetical protein|uniref:hypothetical protein n=1 Tax=Methylomonas sp. TaxID=418 RepID=UPI0025FF6483|nr:hypothetical protein [Methylomonas sp.]MCK9605869.1 hypothetical protein [Methylomonas sp.]
MKRLIRTGDEHNGGLGKMSRMIPPVVANGKVYLMIYRINTSDCTDSRANGSDDRNRCKFLLVP